MLVLFVQFLSPKVCFARALLGLFQRDSFWLAPVTVIQKGVVIVFALDSSKTFFLVFQQHVCVFVCVVVA